MEIVNAERIKTNIEACIERECENCSYNEQTACKETMLCDALALITSQEQRIKELTEEYESMAKSVNEASELIRKLRADKEELTERSKEWEQAYYCMDSACRELSDKCDRLIEENERLRGVGIPDNEVYIRLSDAKHAIMEYACNQTVSKYASAEICKAVRNGAEGAMNELDYITPVKVAPIADTVRKMHHKIWLEFSDCYVEDEITVGSFRASVDQIAKEMLGSTECENKGEEICKNIHQKK